MVSFEAAFHLASLSKFIFWYHGVIDQKCLSSVQPETSAHYALLHYNANNAALYASVGRSLEINLMQWRITMLSLTVAAVHFEGDKKSKNKITVDYVQGAFYQLMFEFTEFIILSL